MVHDIQLPHLGENIEIGKVVKILVKLGQKITSDQNIVELETDKASIEIPAEKNGTVKKIHTKEGDTVKIGQVIVSIDCDNSTTEKLNQEQTPEIQVPENESKPIVNGDVENEQPVTEGAQTGAHRFTGSAKLAPAVPSTRRFAREIGVDINNVSGTGPAGRISVDDVKAFAKSLNSSSHGSLVETRKLPDFKKWGDSEVQAMNNVRIKTAEHLSYAWSSIPHVTQFGSADITNLDSQRKLFAKKVADAGGKLTITAIALKVVSVALQKFPRFNASIDLSNSSMTLKKYCNIGVAVDTDRGLLVPVIRNVDQKNIVQLSKELSEISDKARNKKLKLEDMQGRNFTISNLGSIGGSHFTPIINWPEVAILGISRAEMKAVYVNDNFEPRLMVPLSLSYDHRVIDGADGARFLTWIKCALENPLLISLEG